ncbi:MAG: amidase [Bacteroidia bacterium]|nr:amidase [Bacteroidia bacterium]
MKNCHIKRFVLLLTCAVIVVTCKSPVRIDETNSWLEEMTISDLQQGYKSGKYTIKEVTMAYLDRISAIDKNGPCLNSIIIINPDAIRIAEELDREMAAGKIRGPMHGIPVILKDNIDTKDNMPTTAGSNALRSSFVKDDSFIAKKLRDAGAVIIAKSNLSEWANFRSMVSSSGWSAVGGQTKNPYVLDRNPCGSSSGSGVAVSANLCMAAIGTETDGSIVCPSNNNGIVGIKPTVGLLSRSGIVPISFTQDTPGPMCRTVEDAAACLGAMTGVDPLDSKTLGSEGKYLTDYTKFLKVNGLKEKRIGLVKNSGGYSDMVDTLIIHAARLMILQGAEVIEVEAPARREYEDAEFQVLLYEFKDGLNKYLVQLGDDARVKNLKELIEFNINDTAELRYFDQKIFIDAEKKGDLSTPEYRKAFDQMMKATRDEGIDKMLKDNELDALIAPTGSPAWKTDLLLGDHYVGGNSSLAAIAGYPAITVPMGFIGEQPVGITFIGTAWSEPLLIEIAYSYEQASKHRKAPKYLVTD